MANAFSEKNATWKKVNTELKEVLSSSEYASARSTVNDSFYTPVEVINGIYAALERFGFQGGNVLEPAMGIGNFNNGMNDDMKAHSNLYGVEIDSISGRIAKLLQPSSNIQICGVEQAKLSDNFFDVVLGNVPFGDYHVKDARYDRYKFMIHDYFFAKALDLTRPGGIICFVTSKGTLDKANNTVRKYIAERAELVGAIRLPSNAFLSSANTEVTSDIIFLKKKAVPYIEEPDCLFLGETENGVTVNNYFVSHPEMMLGRMVKDSSFYGEGSNYTSLIAPEDQNLGESIRNAVQLLPEHLFEKNIPVKEKLADIFTVDEVDEIRIPATDDVKNHTYTVIDDTLYLHEDNYFLKCDFDKKKTKRIKGMCKIREALHAVIDIQLNG